MRSPTFRKTDHVIHTYDQRNVVTHIYYWLRLPRFCSVHRPWADPSGRAVWGEGQRPIACWGCDFESRRGHGCLSFVSVVCCQVEVSATGRSLVQRSPTDWDVSFCVMQKPQEWGGHGPRWAVAPQKNIAAMINSFVLLDVAPCMLVYR